MSPLVINLCAGGLIFAILLARSARGREAPNSHASGKAMDIAVAGLVSTNLAGALGLAWLAATMLVNDGVMVIELTICAIVIAVLVMFTVGALVLRRRGKDRAAIALLAVTALPTIASYGFLLYLDSNPIDMR